MNDDNKMYQLFDKITDWDLEEPILGHEKRFAEKLNKQQPKKNKIWIPISIAASLLLSFGILFWVLNSDDRNEVKFSPEVQQTHDYFSSVINQELNQLKEKETPQSRALIQDALKQMVALENDYANLKLEINKNGENKQIVYAMITNMQTRISFIKSVLDQVDTINKLKIENNENHS